MTLSNDDVTRQSNVHWSIPFGLSSSSFSLQRLLFNPGGSLEACLQGILVGLSVRCLCHVSDRFMDVTSSADGPCVLGPIGTRLAYLELLLGSPDFLTWWTGRQTLRDIFLLPVIYWFQQIILLRHTRGVCWAMLFGRR